MKTLTRIGAVLSFGFCSLAGVCVLLPALSRPKEDAFILAALGLLLLGLGSFFGSSLWLKADSVPPRQAPGLPRHPLAAAGKQHPS